MQELYSLPYALRCGCSDSPQARASDYCSRRALIEQLSAEVAGCRTAASLLH